jgi:medium-chain acyl-[acyl-carrier-protein] hydrolase
VQLPGRAGRFREPLFTRMPPLLDALEQCLQPLFEEGPFALFGHSMGALVSFELSRRLKRRGGAEPIHLFVSGRDAPHVPDSRPPRHTLADAEFVAELRKYGGTPEEVLREAELMELVLPVLRADFQLIETWVHTPGEPLDIPISTFGGLSDSGTSREGLEAWRSHTRHEFALHMLAGDHFFIQSAEQVLLGQLSRALSPGSRRITHSDALRPSEDT